MGVLIDWICVRLIFPLSNIHEHQAINFQICKHVLVTVKTLEMFQWTFGGEYHFAEENYASIFAYKLHGINHEFVLAKNVQGEAASRL
jgi:hypothetical protein